MKKVLLMVATHGNEPIGPEVAERLDKSGLGGYYDVLVANPKAREQNIRFVDCDLNRSYPGDSGSADYEMRQAADNLALARKYDYVIDIHEASAGKDDFIIVPRKMVGAAFPVGKLGMDKVLLWPDPAGPLGSVLDNAVELEFGMQGRKQAQAVASCTDIIGKFIRDICGIGTQNSRKQKTYRVYGRLYQSEYKGSVSDLVDFREADIKGERFLPLLTGQYLEEGIVCYKMRET